MLRARFHTSRRRPAPGGVSMWQWRTAGTNKKSAGNTRLIFAFSTLHCVVLFFLPLSQIENESEDRPENIAFQHHAAAPAEEGSEHIPANNNKSAQMGQQIIGQSQPPIQFENQRQQRQRHEEIDEICAKLVEKSTNAAQRFHFCFNGQHFRMIAQSGKEVSYLPIRVPAACSTAHSTTKAQRVMRVYLCFLIKLIAIPSYSNGKISNITC